MRDVSGINFRIMNEEARVELIHAFMNEAIDAEWDDPYVTAGLQALVRIPNGEPLDVEVPEVEDEGDLTDIQRVAQMIDYHFGNFA